MTAGPGRACLYRSPIGRIVLTAEGSFLTGLMFEGQKHTRPVPAPLDEGPSLPVLREAAEWLDLYFSGKCPGSTPALRPEGTSFQMLIWRLLLSVPYGRTITYGELAAQASKEAGLPRTSARAVGGAVARNPISLIIPCHRVIGADGSLTGYAGGIERKTFLLRLERAIV